MLELEHFSDIVEIIYKPCRHIIHQVISEVKDVTIFLCPFPFFGGWGVGWGGVVYLPSSYV